MEMDSAYRRTQTRHNVIAYQVQDSALRVNMTAGTQMHTHTHTHTHTRTHEHTHN